MYLISAAVSSTLTYSTSYLLRWRINLVCQAKVLQQYRSKYVLLQYQIKSKLPASVHESVE